MNFDLQLFAEKNLQNQSSNQLRKGIRSFQKQIIEHQQKIKEPWYWEILDTIYSRLEICEQNTSNFGYPDDCERKYWAN